MTFLDISRFSRPRPKDTSPRSRAAEPSEHFLFDHIPRTGGTYFASILDQLIGTTSENFDCGPDWPAVHREEIARIDGYQVINGHMRLETIKAFRQIRPRHLISIVRDPVELIASTYKFWRHNIMDDVPHCNRAKEVGFSEFIREPEMRIIIDNPMTRHFFGLWDFENLETSHTSETMAIKMADSYEFIGVTERMEDSVLALTRLFPTRQISQERLFIQARSNGSRNGSKGRVTVSDEDTEFLKAHNELDYAVYRHVNESLDDILSRPY